MQPVRKSFLRNNRALGFFRQGCQRIYRRLDIAHRTLHVGFRIKLDIHNRHALTRGRRKLLHPVNEAHFGCTVATIFLSMSCAVAPGPGTVIFPS
ncbi:MAG: hypothetical protein CM15mP21_5390 [Hyphomicrobiales bacterium]|nr:MAG: hypothetical protein CM15mP21_5390 [Hyphomicrobiales bacterium]